MVVETFAKIDWPEIAKIYKEGIETGLATFETKVPDWKAWDRSHLNSCRLKARHNDRLVGWAALSPVSTREVYKGVMEVSIYIGLDFQGFGFGKKLLSELVKCSEENGIWTLQAVIIRENAHSIGLHEQLGFRIVGYREMIGHFNGHWHDTVLMERRSQVVNAMYPSSA